MRGEDGAPAAPLRALAPLLPYLARYKGRLVAALAALSYEPVTLERSKVCANCVVSEIECLGKLIHSAERTAQQRNDLATCTRKKTLVTVRQ